MSVIERIHGGYVQGRRVRVLAERLVALLPAGAVVLDVGCGDGALAAELQRRRPDLRLQGIDVLVRQTTYIPVEPFDGRVMPFPERSFDALLFVDVLHHTEAPLALLQEAVRVTRGCVVIKDHLLDGFLAGPTLRFMDRVGNARYDVALPHNYWRRQQWQEAFQSLGLVVETWDERLRLYPWPASLLFGRSLHFLARLQVARDAMGPNPSKEREGTVEGRPGNGRREDPSAPGGMGALGGMLSPIPRGESEP